MINYSAKRSLLASFFIYATSSAMPTAAMQAGEQSLQALSESPTWQSLLHIEQNEPAITDHKFLLSAESFSKRQELQQTLLLLQQDPQQVCNFPARALWLSQQQLLPTPNFQRCPELTEFLQNVPLDSLHLVFSAENLSQPSSMMGHILLKTQGASKTGQQHEYGITFFTEINAINLPKTIYDTMIAGSPGFFALGPYSDNLKQYLVREKRNVWEYQLALSDFDKRLIQLHFWELKNKNIDYFFTGYNCATLTNMVLSLAEPSLLKQDNRWYTPLDVVKAVHNTNMVASTKVISSADWRIRMLTEHLGQTSSTPALKKQLSALNTEHLETQLLQLELITAVNEYELTQGDITPTEYDIVQQKISQRLSQLPSYKIDISNYKRPTQTPHDSKFTFGVQRHGDSNRATLSFIPASHQLTDDNRQYFAESELKLGQITLSYDNQEQLQLDSFNLYNMLTLTPYHSVTGGISGGFNIRYQRQLTSLNQSKHVTEFGGQLGLTQQISDHLYLYGLSQLQLSTDIKHVFLVKGLKVGALFYGSDKMKTLIELSRTIGSGNTGFDYSELSWQQSIFVSPEFNIKYKQSYLSGEHQSQHNYSLTLEYLF